MGMGLYYVLKKCKQRLSDHKILALAAAISSKVHRRTLLHREAKNSVDIAVIT